MNMHLYLEASARTAPVLEGSGSSHLNLSYEQVGRISEALRTLLCVANDLDTLKREIFYRPVSEYGANGENAQVGLNQKGMDFLHAVLGLGSEVGELAGPAALLLEGVEVDRVNAVEETGDIMWYLAMMLRTLDSSFGNAADANIKKLFARYPEKFDGLLAINRDTVVERAGLERDGK